MNLKEFLKEETWGTEPKEITEKILDVIFPRIKKNTNKDDSVDITSFFPSINKFIKAKVIYRYLPNDERKKSDDGCTKREKGGLAIEIYLNYNELRNEYSLKVVENSFKEVIEHEVVHCLDFIRSGGLTNTYKLKKEYGNLDKYDKAVSGGEGLKAYFKDDLEKNRLFTQIVEFFKSNPKKTVEKILNKKSLIKFIDIKDGKNTAKAFNEDPKLYKALILRLNREGVFPSGFK